jgi:hypothetical protein
LFWKIRPSDGTIGDEPALIETLAEDCALSIIVEFEQRAGTEPFATMTEEEAVAELRRLWKLHGETTNCIKRYGAGPRPTLWWDGKELPHATARDWNSPEDRARFVQSVRQRIWNICASTSF